jgi:uncharacterized protein
VNDRGGPPRPAALAGVAVLLAVLFSLLFVFRRLGPLDFFWGLACNIVVACGAGFAVDRGYAARLRADLERGWRRKAGLGVLSAVLLYGLFVAGKLAALRIFPFAAAGISSVYGLKSGVDIGRVVLLIGLVIGPGEEIVWRGFLQENLDRRLGRTAGFVLTALAYTLVHVGSGSVMLVLAAAVCGLFWGGLYLRFRSPLLNIVSHTVWDLLIFVVLPV